MEASSAIWGFREGHLSRRPRDSSSKVKLCMSECMCFLCKSPDTILSMAQ